MRTELNRDGQVKVETAWWTGLFKFALAGFPVLVTLLVAFCVWVVATVYAHEAKFQSVTPVSETLQVWKEIGDLKVRIAAIPEGAPPTWLIDRIDRLEKRQDEFFNAIRADLEILKRRSP